MASFSLQAQLAPACFPPRDRGAATLSPAPACSPLPYFPL